MSISTAGHPDSVTSSRAGHCARPMKPTPTSPPPLRQIVLYRRRSQYGRRFAPLRCQRQRPPPRLPPNSATKGVKEPQLVPLSPKALDTNRPTLGLNRIQADASSQKTRLWIRPPAYDSALQGNEGSRLPLFPEPDLLPSTSAPAGETGSFPLDPELPNAKRNFRFVTYYAFSPMMLKLLTATRTMT